MLETNISTNVTNSCNFINEKSIFNKLLIIENKLNEHFNDLLNYESEIANASAYSEGVQNEIKSVFNDLEAFANDRLNDIIKRYKEKMLRASMEMTKFKDEIKVINRENYELVKEIKRLKENIFEMERRIGRENKNVMNYTN